jgi:hypothetical protein
MANARQRFYNERYRSNQLSRKVNLLCNSPITINTAATNRVTIQNGVRYSVDREGIKGKLQTFQLQHEPVRARVKFKTVHDSSRQFTKSSRQEVRMTAIRKKCTTRSSERVQEPQTRLLFVCCKFIKRIIIVVTTARVH